MPKFLKKLLIWIDQLLDPQPAAPAAEEPEKEIDFESFFTDPLYPD